ncbi:MAG: hypothetical protein LBL33_05270 [Tannerella sp.]|jgi:hypothetical protein|nr:hypothetical protein [Tannerella sp.]
MSKTSRVTKQSKKTTSPGQNLIEKTNAFFDRYEKAFVVLSMTLGILMCILLFDVKVSLSGDDCDYIIAAGDFWKNGTYPGHHGPLYPILLSPFVGLLGVQLIVLKSISVIFMMTSLWLFYKSFRQIVPSSILLPALLLICINPHVLFFASYTYSEPLFMLMQALFFYLFSTHFRNGNSEFAFKKDWIKHLALAFVIMGMGLTRTIGFCTIGIIILYFMIERRWKEMISITGIFAIIFSTFYFLKPLIWPDSGSVHSFEELLAKNPYNLGQGPEDIPGLIRRVIENSHIYLSGFLYRYFGFRSHSAFPLESIPILTIFTYTLFIISLIFVFKKNKPLLFTGLYAGISTFANLVLLHSLWAQDRIIMVYYPYILLFLLGGAYYLLKNNRFKNFTWIYSFILISIFIGTSTHSMAKVGNNLPVLQQNILGNDLYGLTPDWENFIKMSRWANDNLDKNAVIASRKPSISYVYTGRNFAGIYNVPKGNLEDVVNLFDKENDENIFLVINLNKNIQLNLAPYIQYLLTSKKEDNFQINGETVTGAGIYQIPKSVFNEDLTSTLDSYNINYTLDHETFIKQYIDSKEPNYSITNPDILLKIIKDGNIKYLLLPKIRVYTPQNTGLYINTIHQYISFIHIKYPNSFTLIHTIGKEETCELVEYTGP